jgi:membrane protease YdiL (CAAX protease family)
VSFPAPKTTPTTTPTGRFLAQAGPTHPVMVAILGVCFIAGGQLVVSLPVQLAHLKLSPTANSVLLLLSFIPVWVLLWAWMRFVEHRPLRRIGLDGRRADLLIGIGIALAILAVDAAVMAASGQVSFHWGGEGAAGIGVILATLALFAIQASAEEAVIRGFVMQGVGAGWGVWAGLAVQAVIFAVLHGSNPGATPVALGNVAGFGLMLGLLVLWRGSLWAAIGFHAVWNWAEGMVLGDPVSGLGFGRSVLAQTVSPDASAMMTGGSFGPEGSLVTLGALILTIAAVGWAWWRSMGAPRRQNREHAPQ